MTEWLSYPVVQGAMTGLLTAAAVDYAAFRSWKTYEDARSYDWRVAAWRWFQGLTAGALTALGFLGAGV